MEHNHFVNNTLSELQEANRNPIYGYQHLLVLTLEEATKGIIPLVPGVANYVSTAKKECNRRSTLLTRDESAAIYLYSMQTPIFSSLNNTLRAKSRPALKPWFAFLNLFINALKKLPSTKDIVWRGINDDVSSMFVDNDVQTWWSVNSCSMALNVVECYLGEKGTVLAIDAIHAKDISAFSAMPDEKEFVLMPGTRVRVKCPSLNFIHRFFLIHLTEENEQSESQIEQTYLSKLLKQECQQHSRIERIMNPSKSFPIEQSYINLAIVETKEQQEKEKKLVNANHNNEIIGTFEQIYGTKTSIETKNIFEKCKDQTKNILVLGRAGIGKTTFCRYVAYQWATGAIWQQYQLVIFIRLRNLTESRYPPLAPGTRYSLIDLVKTEYFYHGLSEEYERLLKEELNKNEVLWLLDGYDEIVQNIPAHLQYLLEKLLKTPHHILTSRPYLNTLQYNVQLEITGFTDDNINEYVEKFFDQIKDEIDNASLQAQKLLGFLECNPRIWGIVHIPVNLELMCSLWCDTDWSETTTLTMTTVYDKMIEWLCRRHLEKQKISSNQMGKENVYTYLLKELAFLESLAFHGMESKSIILPPKLLRIATKESETSPLYQPHLLNIGILKSLDYKPIGTCIEADKNHYFLHLSFQEHFAARYLVKALNSTADQKKKAIDFIKTNKYNQRFELVFAFASGLLVDNDDEQCMDLFWKALFGEPLDLIGLRHVQIVISCLEEAACSTTIPYYRESINLILKWITYLVSQKHKYSYQFLSVALERSPSLVSQREILDTLVKFYNDKDPNIRQTALLLISKLPISNQSIDLIQLYLPALNDEDMNVRDGACQALGKMGEKAATNEVINRLSVLLGDTNDWVRSSAHKALWKMGEKAATNEVIHRLLLLLGDTDYSVKNIAYEVLGNMDEKAATNEVINSLLPLLGDTNDGVKNSACEALQNMGEKTKTNEVIKRLLLLLADKKGWVKKRAYESLGKMGEKAATNEVIKRLLPLLDDTKDSITISACEVLGNMREKAATNEVINRLLLLLGDKDDEVKKAACYALGNMGKKAATTEVINRLLLLLGNKYYGVKEAARYALGKMGEKGATNEVINRLLLLLGDTNDAVRRNAREALREMSKDEDVNQQINRINGLHGDKNYWAKEYACHALREMGEKAASNELINRLMLILDDNDYWVREAACYALRNLGEKAATNKVINRLMLILDDNDCWVRKAACYALGNMGEKAATNEVINRLLLILDDEGRWVRKAACYALGNMGEKAATDEVINRLLVLLGDTHCWATREVCYALGNMGEKAATDEVINRLLLILDDKHCWVREAACYALGNMGEKAATTEVINRLLLLLGDSNYSIGSSAREALGKMGEKGATNEVINKLPLLLRDPNDTVRGGAYQALFRMREKAATTEVINRLLLLLDDTDYSVKNSACNLLRDMGEKAATDEVINKLTLLLGDKDYEVKKAACYALGNMGEKAVTNEVINRLLVLLGDSNYSIRSSAFYALGKMGEKGATNEVINKLTLLLGDTNDSVRSSAYEALGKMGEKAATNEVINRVSLLLGDTNVGVRYSACQALEKMGEKAETNEVIKRLLLRLGDTAYSVKNSACKVLRNMGEKLAMSTVVGILLDARWDDDFGLNDIVDERTGNLFDLLPCMPNFEGDIDNGRNTFHFLYSWFENNNFPEEFIRVFLHTKRLFWLPFIARLLIKKGYGITITENTVVVYGSKDPVPLRFTEEEIGQRLRNYLFNWLDKSLDGENELQIEK